MISCLPSKLTIVAAMSTVLFGTANADQATWGDYNLSTIQTFPGEGAGHVASILYTNRMNYGANGLVLHLVEGIEITVTVDDGPSDTPDQITISVPDGYIAVPSVLVVPENGTSSADIFEAAEVPLG